MNEVIKIAEVLMKLRSLNKLHTGPIDDDRKIVLHKSQTVTVCSVLKTRNYCAVSACQHNFKNGNFLLVL